MLMELGVCTDGPFGCSEVNCTGGGGGKGESSSPPVREPSAGTVVLADSGPCALKVRDRGSFLGIGIAAPCAHHAILSFPFPSSSLLQAPASTACSGSPGFESVVREAHTVSAVTGRDVLRVGTPVSFSPEAGLFSIF